MDNMKTSVGAFPTATKEWLASSLMAGASGFHSQLVTMTPEIAIAILDRNEDNRSMNDRNLCQIKADILAGAWAFNGEAIIISREGLLNDGQHRLRAIAETGRSVPVLVCFGVERESRKTVDQGSKRDAGDILSIDGVHNAKATAALASIILRYESGDGTQLPSGRGITSIAIASRAKSDAGIRFCASFSQSHARKLAGWLPPRVLGAAYYLFRSIDEGLADDFIRQIVDGENIRRGDPAFAVRAQLITLRTRSDANVLEIIMRGWNAFINRRELKLAKNLGSLPPLV